LADGCIRSLGSLAKSEASWTVSLGATQTGLEVEI